MKPVDDYLEQLDGQLNDLPSTRRVEIIGETRDHLEAMIAARRADGMDENAAWQSTQSAFGEAEMVGRELAREWKRVETVGTPLSKLEKRKLLTRYLLIGLVFYPLMMLAVFGLLMHHLGGLLIVLAPVVLIIQIHWHRKGDVPFTPSGIISMFVGCGILFIMGLKFHFQSEYPGLQLISNFLTCVSPLMFGALLLLAVLLKREEKTTRPWRALQRYASNPIGAEEEYQFGPNLFFLIGLLIGCMANFYAGWLLHGLGFAARNCLVLIVLMLLYARFFIEKAR